MHRAKSIFGNLVSDATFRKAEKAKKKLEKKFGNDYNVHYSLSFEKNEILYPSIKVQNIVTKAQSETVTENFDPKGIIVGNIRMGFGHYRISMAIASAVTALGYTPYWFDLNAFQETTGGKIISHLNGLYSMGSRWSQKYPLFNQFYWEPLNSEGFRKLSYNASDQMMSELFTPIFRDIPKDMPFIGTHVWPSQAAVHAGIKKVINVIPDNWPMALHLAEGSIHTVQTPSAYLGYKTLKGMDGEKVLKPIPSSEIAYTGHYIDHELVSNINLDCRKRVERILENKTKRILLTVGGAGAQKEIYSQVIKEMIPRIKAKEVALFLNVGDHNGFWQGIKGDLGEIKDQTTEYINDWTKTATFAENALDHDVTGLHVFYNSDIFAAVYGTNLLMRASDVLITKPSELAFYPVPKLLIKRVGGHEAWGAITAAEIGDGSIECSDTEYAVHMLNLMLEDPAILTLMNESIVNAKSIGIYDGAYKAVKLALE